MQPEMAKDLRALQNENTRLNKRVDGKLRDELVNRELFLRMQEVRWMIGHWRLDDNHHRIHNVLNYQTPAAYAAGCVLPASATPHSRVT